jgi:hypothetical protein
MRIAKLHARRRQGTPIGTLMHEYRVSKTSILKRLRRLL